MKRSWTPFVLAAILVMGLPCRSPAPLIYTPGEGWSYETAGSEGGWKRNRAKDQLIVAQNAFDQKDYRLAIKAARRVVKVWPLSDYAPQAQYLVGRGYEARGLDDRAFKEYETLLQHYPKSTYYDEVLRRQYNIANLFLAGRWFHLFTFIPFFPSMEKTAGLYEKIIKNGPYSDVAPQAQLKLGETREKQSNYAEAVKAYERAADRYSDRPQIAAEAVFKEGLAYKKQAQSAEYDQGTAGQAIATFTDFMALFPEDPRVPEAQKYINALRSEQARGNFEIAKYYARSHKWNGALVYYNEVLLRDPSSVYAARAREQIEAIKKRLLAAPR
jgi:outer membrane protein assembly factor BamD